jgi:hypothetical protein
MFRMKIYILAVVFSLLNMETNNFNWSCLQVAYSVDGEHEVNLHLPSINIQYRKRNSRRTNSLRII